MIGKEGMDKGLVGKKGEEHERASVKLTFDERLVLGRRQGP